MRHRPVLEVRHLRLVEAVRRHGGVTSAAATLHLSQSALSHQLVNLERDLGLALFERVGKKMTPTPAGERLAETARQVLRQLDEAEADLRDPEHRARRRLRVGAACSTLYPWLASHISRQAVEAPELDVRVSFDIRGREAEALLALETDLVITSRPPGDRRFERRKLFAVETIALLPAGHQLAEPPQGPVTWPALAGETLLVHDLQAVDEMALRTATAAAGGPSARLLSVQLTEAIVELVRAGQGIGVLSDWPSAAPALPPDVVRKGFRPAYRRAFWAVWRADGAAAAAAAGFVAAIATPDEAPANVRDDEVAALL